MNVNIRYSYTTDLNKIKDLFTLNNPVSCPDFFTMLSARNHVCLSMTLQGDDDSNIIGFIIGQHMNHEIFHISYFIIDSNYRKKGFGKMLMNAIENIAKSSNKKYITLYVHVENSKALRLYYKRGYFLDKYLPNYYCGYERFYNTSNSNIDGYKLKKNI